MISNDLRHSTRQRADYAPGTARNSALFKKDQPILYTSKVSEPSRHRAMCQVKLNMTSESEAAERFSASQR